MNIYDIAIARKLSGGGGGGSWTVLTEESVTTVDQGGFNVGALSYIFTSEPPETLRITFDGTAYECEAISSGDAYSYGGIGEQGPDFSVYPFALNVTPDRTLLFTETAGTYSIKIEAPGGGGGGGDSDFSTATVTFTNSVRAQLWLASLVDTPDETYSIPIIDGSRGTARVILYKGMALGFILDEGVTVTTTGAVEYDDEEGVLIVTGDGSITIA